MAMAMKKGSGVEPLDKQLQESGSRGRRGGGLQGVKHLPESSVTMGSRDWIFPQAIIHLANQLEEGRGGRIFNKLIVFRLKCLGLFLMTTVSHGSITSRLGIF